jgi:lysozyme
MSRQVDDEGRAAIKRFEACRLEAYQDAVGVWTIGYGSTRGVRAGMAITQDDAERRLSADLEPAESAVDRLVMVDLTDGQFDALVSFVFNVGEGTFKTSTLLKKLNAGKYAAVPAELQRFRYAHGRPLKGLSARRAAEAGLWARGSYVATNTAPVDPKILGLMTPETLVAGLGTVGALGGAAANPGPLQWALAGVIGLAMVGLAWFAYRRFAEV